MGRVVIVVIYIYIYKVDCSAAIQSAVAAYLRISHEGIVGPTAEEVATEVITTHKKLYQNGTLQGVQYI